MRGRSCTTRRESPVAQRSCNARTVRIGRESSRLAVSRCSPYSSQVHPGKTRVLVQAGLARPAQRLVNDNESAQEFDGLVSTLQLPKSIAAARTFHEAIGPPESIRPKKRIELDDKRPARQKRALQWPPRQIRSVLIHEFETSV